MERFGHFVWGTGIFIVLLCGFLVLSLTTASVSERHREIGIFRALGFSSGNILSIIMSETFILSVAAGGFGLILTFLLGKIFLPTLTGLKPEDILFPPLLYLSGFIIQLVLALAASLPPAFKAARIDPVQSIAGL